MDFSCLFVLECVSGKLRFITVPGMKSDRDQEKAEGVIEGVPRSYHKWT